jgi:hypothetical protein
MNDYMVIIRFISPFSEEFISLIPEQRAAANELMEKGIITSYSLSIDRRILWINLHVSSRDSVDETLQRMPLFKFMRYETVDLMFHNSPVSAPMLFSLN